MRWINVSFEARRVRDGSYNDWDRSGKGRVRAEQSAPRTAARARSGGVTGRGRTAAATAAATATATATPRPVNANLGFSPKSLNFGKSTKVGSVSKAKAITIKNGSRKKSAIIVSIIGESSLPPFKATTECIEPLAPGKSCKVWVIFSPTDTNKQTGALTIDDNEVGGSQNIPLSGTGKAPK